MSLNKQASNLGVKGWAICVVAIILLWAALYWRFNQAEKNALVLAQQHATDRPGEYRFPWGDLS